MEEVDSEPAWSKKLQNKQDSFVREKESIEDKIRKVANLARALDELDQNGTASISTELIAIEGPGEGLRVEGSVTVGELDDRVGKLSLAIGDEVSVINNKDSRSYTIRFKTEIL